MENASQALLIAGGILLAIIVLSMLVYLGANLSTIGRANQEKEELERLTKWNAEWEAYNKKLLYGAEICTLVNKSKQNDIDYDNSLKYKVEITITKDSKDKFGNVITTNNIKNYANSIFTCTGVEYSDETGRIKSMTFKLEKELE